MQTRRRFFSMLAALPVLSLLVGPSSKADEATPAPARKTFKRIFRRDENTAWREIEWDDMRPGDQVLCVGIHEGELYEFEMFDVLSQPDPNDASGHTKIDNLVHLLPTNRSDAWLEEFQMEIRDILNEITREDAREFIATFPGAFKWLRDRAHQRGLPYRGYPVTE